MKTFSFVFLATVFVILKNTDGAESQTWPNKKEKFPYKIQSPINVIAAKAEHKKLPAFKIQFPSQSSNQIIKIMNTGHTVQVLLPHSVKDRPSITGGPLFNDKYIFEQFHFHWGKNNTCGSEHHLSGKCYPTEVHVVCYKETYDSLKEAVNHPDGLSVVGFFGEPTSKNDDNPNLKNLISKLPDITEPDTSIKSLFEHEVLFLKDLFDKLTYYTYPGSLTTPSYSESVTWIISTKTFKMSTSQINALRTLRGEDGNNIKSNVRALQDINGRPLIGPSQ